MKKLLLDEVNSTLRNYTQGTPKSRQDKRNVLRHIIKDLLDFKIAPLSFMSIRMKVNGHSHHRERFSKSANFLTRAL
jgi:hypothetical protein